MADNKMLIDATHPEETRVVVLRGGRVEEFDYESAARKLLRGNIYLAKVTRVEPALQAAFVDYGGNRHGFLAFSEIHPDYYQIPMADRLALIEEEAAAAAEADEHAGHESDLEVSDDHDEDLGEFDEDTDASDDAQDFDARSEDADAGPDGDDEIAAPAGEALDEETHGDPAEDDAEIASHTANENNSDNDGADSADADSRVPNDVIEQRAESDHILREDAPASNEGDEQSPDAEEIASEASDDAADLETAAEDGSDTQVPISYDENGVPIPLGLVEDQGVEDVNTSNDNNQSEPVEEVGSEDALEEVPSRPRRSRRSYKIQEVIKRRQILLVQVVKEERGNKGAALTTYLSLAGRYTVLMPNTARGGGVSRKISSPQDRKRMKAIAADLEVPEGMGLIIRTAGASRTKQEIRRDFDYLLRLWESVRDLTLESTAPSLVYEEGNLIKRSIRDLYNKDVDEIVVAGEHAHKEAKSFMRMLMPSHTRNVTLYNGPEPVFTRFQIERQLNAMFHPQVPLKSGGYLVINQTEALVAIDVNSGRSTREFSIEETALHTNLEAADEIARQLKLRDLAGLIVIDFIDMDEKRNNRAVERRMKEALRNDRARIQVGRISHFGLMEMSRQRMRTGVLEGSTSQCPHCQGTGIIRSTESVALAVLRGLEDAVMAGARTPLIAYTTPEVALYILNAKREFVEDMETRLGQAITVSISDKMVGANFKIEKGTSSARPSGSRPSRTAVNMDAGFADNDTAALPDDGASPSEDDRGRGEEDKQPRKRRRRRRTSRSGDETAAQRSADSNEPSDAPASTVPADDTSGDARSADADSENGRDEDTRGRRGRRRGRRGGRRNRERREAKRADDESVDEDRNAESGETGAIESDAPAPDTVANAPTEAPTEDVPGLGPQPDLTPPLTADATPAQPGEDAPTAKTEEPATDVDSTPDQPKPRRSRTKREENTAETNAKKPAIEITSIRVGSSPEGTDGDEPEPAVQEDTATASKKSTRTGWWQRRLLGEE